MKNKKKLRTNAEVFASVRRNFNQDDIRKMTTMEIPSQKSKMKNRNRRKQYDAKFYFDGASYVLLVHNA